MLHSVERQSRCVSAQITELGPYLPTVEPEENFL